MKRFCTADLHLNHANICVYDMRPCLRAADLAPDWYASNREGKPVWASKEAARECAERMNNGLIANANMRIKPEDQVIHVGDFAARIGMAAPGIKVKAPELLARLNGRWALIEGNHDKNNDVKPTCRSMTVQIGGFRAYVRHVPLGNPDFDTYGNLRVAPEEFFLFCRRQFDFVICGHVHNAWRVKQCQGLWHINVGVSVQRYMPIDDQEVLEQFAAVKRSSRNETPDPVAPDLSA